MEEHNEKIENCQEKTCRICKETKIIRDFISKRNYCKTCEYTRLRKLYEKKREAVGKVPIEYGASLETDNIRGWKQCSKCLNKCDLSEFRFDKRFNVYCTLCKECQRQKNNNYRKNNREKVRANENRYKKERLKTDIIFKIKKTLRNRIWLALKKNKNGPIKKSKKTIELIGCTIQEFKEYIQKQFIKGMTWENHGKGSWEIDHIIPIDSFDLRIPEEQNKAFHYTNCQPLWQTTDIAKANGDFESIGNGNKGSKILNPTTQIETIVLEQMPLLSELKKEL